MNYELWIMLRSGEFVETRCLVSFSDEVCTIFPYILYSKNASMFCCREAGHVAFNL